MINILKFLQNVVVVNEIIQKEIIIDERARQIIHKEVNNCSSSQRRVISGNNGQLRKNNTFYKNLVFFS